MSTVDGVDLVSIRIDEKLASFTPNDPEYRCIFRVHTQLRNVNEKAYEPKLLAIGPYHCRKNDLVQMEDHKLSYLKQLLQRGGESSVERYVRAIRELEGAARSCNAESICLTSDEFVEMMLLDGCFIIELFRKAKMEELRDERDPIFQLGWMLYNIVPDLLLLENQLPLFVLTKLFEMTNVPGQQDNLIDLAMLLFGNSLSSFGGWISKKSHALPQNSTHLLALLHESITRPYDDFGTCSNVQEWKWIPSATELQEAGVKFKNLDTGGILDIEFNNGVMQIPLLRIEDQSESVFRNLIAYEQYYQNYYPKYVTDYVTLMDCLINSPKDVELLRRRGIIENWLGDDEAVSTMFNKLRDNVILPKYFSYAQLFEDANKHCRRRQNVWMAKLRHNYFNSPWALISFLAAVFLLLLALTQTIFSILPHIVAKM